MGLRHTIAGLTALLSSGFGGRVTEFPAVTADMLGSVRGQGMQPRQEPPLRRTYGNRAAKAAVKRGYSHRRMLSKFDKRLLEVMREVQARKN